MRSVLLSGLTGCVGLVVGASLASNWNRHTPLAGPPVSPPSLGGEPAVARSADDAELDSRLRRVISEEFARRDAAAAANAERPATPAAIATLPSPEVMAQSARANEVLDAAITRLSWTNQDASEFRRAISSLSGAERRSLMRKFARAVNEQNMRLETDGPPF